MAINLNTFPYYDDATNALEESYHRILFKPGYAVQARELTQIQSVLQEQIKRFGDHVFKEGSVITGAAESYNFRYAYIKVLDVNAAAPGIDLTNYVGRIVENITAGDSVGVRALIRRVEDGSVGGSPNLKTLYVQYISSGASTPGNTVNTFEADDTLTLEGSPGGTFTVAGAGETPIGIGSFFSVGDGIVYASGAFILHNDQTIVIDRYSNLPDAKVGFRIVDSIITSDDNESLLDPSQGSFNYTAPGADRYKLETVLVSYPLNAALDAGFFLLFEVEAGVIKRRYNRPQYAELRKELASRTFDESGNYTVRAFPVVVNEHLRSTNGANKGRFVGGDASKLAVGVLPGKAYVHGFEYELFGTETIAIDKAINTIVLEDQPTSTYYGNYLLVNTVMGEWDFAAYGQLTLRDAGVTVGSAAFRSIEHETGTTYRLHLYDIVMNSGEVFSDVDNILGPNSSSANLVNTNLYEATFSGTIFKIPTDHAKTLAPGAVYDNTFAYKKRLTGSFASGTMTLTLSGETWAATASGNYPATSILRNFYIVNDSSDAVVDFTATGRSITYNSATSITLNANGAEFNGVSFIVIANVRRADVQPKNKTIGTTIVRFQTKRTFALGAIISTASPTLTVGATATTFVAPGDRVYWSGVLSSNANEIYLGTVSSASGVTITLNANAAGANNESGTISVHSPLWSIPTINTLTTTVATALNSNFVTAALAGTTVLPGDAIYQGTGLVFANFVGIVDYLMSNNSGFFLKENAATALSGSDSLIAKRISPPKLSLGLVDVFATETIWAANNDSSVAWGVPAAPDWTEVTGSFALKTGQTDSLYTTSWIEAISDDFDNKLLFAKVKFFKHTSSGTNIGFFSKDSYPVPAAENTAPNSTQINIWEIPVYGGFDLRNCLDFRLSHTNSASEAIAVYGVTASYNPSPNTAFDGSVPFMPAPDYEFISDVEFYTARQDRITLDADGVFQAIRGIPSTTPAIPQQPERSMTLAEVSIPPYPSLSPHMARSLNRPASGVTIRHLNNKRYTMRDIGQIEKRLDTLEYYTSLSLLEASAENLLIIGPTGDSRFKNGILVDSFTGHNVANVYDPHYRAAIDPRAGELRPYFNIENIDLVQSSLVNAVRNAAEATIVVEQLNGNPTYPLESTVTDGPASGTVEHAVVIATGTTYKWVRLYLVGVTGAFAAGNTVTSGPSTGTIPTNMADVTRITAINLPLTQRPSAIVAPTAGDLITLPYTSRVYTKNPYATKSRNVVSQLIFTYFGEITLDPPQDIWIDTVELPEVQINVGNNNDNWSVSTNDISSPDCSPNAWRNDLLSLGNTTPTAWCRWWDLRNQCLAQAQLLPLTSQLPGITACQNFRGDVTTPFGTEWGSWETVWTGVTIDERLRTESEMNGWRDGVGTLTTTTLREATETTASRQTRTGIRVNWIPETRVEDQGSREVNRNIIPFMRSTLVKFNAVRMKPDTVIHPLFDGIDVSAHCRPVGDAFGDALITSATGAFSGEFRIPAGVFTTGSKMFELVDDLLRRPDVLRTRASEVFTASGQRVERQNTITTTRTVRPVLTAVEDSQNQVVSRIVGSEVVDVTETEFVNWDPTAQTFFISNRESGTFITKMDLYFRTKSLTAPVTVQIREVVNGYPGAKIVPFGSVTLEPKDINISVDATAPTQFKFPSLVYLENAAEYCFVILPAGNSDEYNLWVSELGENQFGTTERVSEQPHTGVLFVSANNNTWTALQAEDVKFSIYEAAFNTGVTGSVILKNEDLEYLFVPGVEAWGVGDVVTSKTGAGVVKHIDKASNIAKVLSTSGTFDSPNPASPTLGSALTGTITTILSDATVTGVGTLFLTELDIGSALRTAGGTIIGIVETISSNIELELELPVAAPGVVTGAAAQVAYQVVSNQAGVKLSILDNETKYFSVFTPNLTFLNFARTTLAWDYSATNSNLGPEGYAPFTTNGTTDTLKELVVLPVSDGAASLLVRGQFTAAIDNVSPVIDLKKMGLIVVGNVVNNDSSDEAVNAGTASSRYISRKVTLDLDDAENIRVYLTANQPARTDVKVYGKFLNREDPTAFDLLPWIELTETEPGDTNGFSEYYYELAGSHLNGSDIFQYTNPITNVTHTTYKTFAIKIVMLSSSTSIVPRIRDLRAIAVS